MPDECSMTGCHGLNVEVDLSNVGDNYLFLKHMCPTAEVAAVVKANAYGLGARAVSRHLAALGCTVYFVAHLNEAMELRRHVPDAAIYVLNGLMPGTGDVHRALNLKPVLTSESQLAEWVAYCREKDWRGTAALHVDTGINRLGFRLEEIAAVRDIVASAPDLFDLVLSHLACGDVVDHPRNRTQIEAFAWARRELSLVRRASLAATAGCFLGSMAHFDLVRPGIGLYGGNPFNEGPNPFSHVVSVSAPLLQVKRHRQGEYVGYGDSHRLAADSLVGVISFGYADGVPRRAGQQENAAPLSVRYRGRELPILGRISMDMSMVDLTPVAALNPSIGHLVQICSPIQPVDALARIYGSIPNEILTSLGRRAKRIYFTRDNIEGRRSERWADPGASRTAPTIEAVPADRDPSAAQRRNPLLPTPTSSALPRASVHP
jgi:alanine racemase